MRAKLLLAIFLFFAMTYFIIAAGAQADTTLDRSVRHAETVIVDVASQIPFPLPFGK